VSRLSEGKSFLLSHLASALPERPWQKFASDLFYWQGQTLLVDYFPMFVELAPLKKDTSASEVIEALKQIFAQHGNPDKLVSSNGPQYSAYAFRMFPSSYDFRHTTSRPKFSQSNGESDAQTISDMHSALLAYRAI